MGKVKNKFNSVHIADIHFGCMEPTKLMNELKNVFFRYIDDHANEIDLIVIHGDFFDRKLSLTDNSSITGFKFMSNLTLFCKSKKIQLRLLKGTKTHDYNQLNNFKAIEKMYPKTLRIINTVTEEIIDGFKILYVPEEYMNNQNEYYKEFKEKEYDFIYGHGTWDVFAFNNQIIESERNISNSPVFIYNEWCDSVKYNIIFGHIHVNNNHKKLYYPGSFSRWIFGEEKYKGFLVCEVDKTKEKSKINFIKNELATEYNTVLLSTIVPSKDLNKVNLESIIKSVEERNTDFEKVRLKIDLEIPKQDIAILKESFSDNSNIKLEMTSLKDKIENEVIETYDFLKNDTITNIITYVKQNYNTDITKEQIEELTSNTD